MKKLNEGWLTEGLIDFEYKKYILLAYFKYVKKNFGEKKLYPLLSDLVFHYKNLLDIKDNKKIIYENFPKEISRADFEKLQIIYKKLVDDEGVMKEIEDILSFSIPKFRESLSEGKDIYEDIADKIKISPIGISPLYPDEGYVFLTQPDERHAKVFEYQVTIFESSDEKYRGIHMNFLESISKGIGNTFESLKIELVRKYKKLPNPATFLIESNVRCPFQETLLPIAKRMLVKHIYSA
ncbi:hypothetical protein RCC89_13925 [Cytophagaceae bacterium ABcell3]|nr:hypothetical protein RCC89_13925 [Cytophagaceae bacterium ABcell3]